VEIKDWYKLTFQIESDAEDIIIWKLNELGICSFSFEYLIKNENKKEVNVWLPIDDWGESSRSGFEKIISTLLNINDPKNQFFDWSIIKEEDWLTSWKKYWAPELVGNHLLILPCWMNLNEKFKDKKIIKIDPGAAFGTGSHPSTYLSLEKMENILFSDKKVLDIGSGSGILSVAARLLGAKEVCAVDNDYLAINSTNSNFLIVKLSLSSNLPASNALHFSSPSFKDAAPELSNLLSSEPSAQFLKRFCLLLSNHPSAVNNMKIKSNGNQSSPCNI